MKPKFLKGDIFLSAAAILISLGTLYTVWYQTELMRKQQFASVLPYLEIWPQRQNEQTWALILINNGLGPAFVKKVQVVTPDTIYEGDLVNFLENGVAIDEDEWDSAGSTVYSNIIPGRLIPAGEQIQMFKSTGSEQNYHILEREIYDEGAKLEIIFASVYDEYWIVDDYAEAPKPCKNVKNCGTKPK